MEYTKEYFKEHIEALRTLKNSKGGLNYYGEGRLSLAEAVENLILCEVGVSVGKMECEPSFNTQKTIRYNSETKECFDELGNFLGLGEYNESTKTMVISDQH